MVEAAAGFTSSASTPPCPPLPRMLGRRILLKLAARGGMGEVYLAATTGIEGAERPCIVKTVRRDHAHDGSFLARFLDEARVQAQLQHPGVAQVLEATTDDGGEPYTVVEYVEGRALSDVRQRAIQMGERLGWADATAIAIEVAQALAHVHERSGPDGAPLGIVHRDLSPQNVMIGYAGEVKLIDFGTARGHNRRCRTVAGVVFAKPGYVAPEVARQQVGDARIDVYALGIMFWELCAGRRFLTVDPQRHLDDLAADKVVVPAIAQACGAPRELDAIIAELTANQPDDRSAQASLAVPKLVRLLSSAPPSEGGERSVRARIAHLMKRLWPHEPARSRAEFARLLQEGREGLAEDSRASETPAAPVSGHIAARMTTGQPDMLLGTPYRLMRKIGEGSGGSVWEAEHVELGRVVALKVLAPEHASSKDAFERFRREARAIAPIAHPNLVQILDFGRSLDGRAYLAMELCPGRTLDARLHEGPLDWREAARIATAAARALEAAHEAGLVHRDLKPQNLMLAPAASTMATARGARRGGDAAVKLLDFGVAAVLSSRPGDAAGPPESRERAMRGLAIFGTPEYMAPEQVAGEPVDGRTDLYALGCVLYEMLTGFAAFEGPSAIAVMGKQLRETPVAPSARRPSRDIPRAIDAVVMRAMAKRPTDRFPSATAMREAIEAALALPDRRRARARRWVAVSVTCAATVAACVTAARWAAPQIGRRALAETPPPVLVQTSVPPLPSQTAAEPPHVTPIAAPPSLRDARAAARARPADGTALEAWAHAALRAGDLREARRAASAWALHDGTLPPRLFLSEVLGASGRRAEAQAVVAHWLASHPDAADAPDALARLVPAGTSAEDPPVHELAHR